MLLIKVFKHNTAKDALEFVCEIDNPDNVFYTTALYDSGDFTIQINKNKNFADQLQLARFIVINSDYERCGIITEVEQKIDEQGKISEIITVKGKEAKQILADRIVLPPGGFDYYNLVDEVETCIKNIVTGNIGTSASTERQRTDLSVVADAGRGVEYTMNARYDNLFEVVRTAGELTNSGTKIYIDPVTKTFVFDTVFGLDRTIAQSTNSVVVFSTDFDTLRSAVFTQTIKDYITLAVVGGTGEGAARTIENVFDTTEPEGADRKERFIDARDLTTTAELESKGLAEINNSTQTYLTGKQLTYSSFNFKTDYNIGDTITIKAFDNVLSAQITAVKESWSYGSYDIELTFGKQQLGFDTAVRKNSVENFKIKAV